MLPDGRGSPVVVPRGRGSPVVGPAQLIDDFRQAVPVDKLHGVVMHAAVAADEIDRHDVLMLQVGSGLSLVLEALQLPGIERAGQGQDFQGDTPDQRKLLGLVDDPHAAPADFTNNAEVAKHAGNRLTRLGRGYYRR